MGIKQSMVALLALAIITLLLAFATWAWSDIEGSKFAQQQLPIVFRSYDIGDTTATINVKGVWSVITATYSISSITDTVFAQLQGSNDNSSWVNLDADGDTLAYMEDGSYGASYPYATGYNHYRFVSWGDTAADVAGFSVMVGE